MEDMRERRKDRRVAVDITGEFECAGTVRTVRVVDISVGGALLDCPDLEWPEEGRYVGLCLNLERKNVAFCASLVRKVPPSRAAITFVNVPAALESTLARFVQDQDRKALRAHLHLRGSL
jgi:c-di-GMP-binding flagellar brake protein YcgR